jgi:hypothetical protein
MKAALMIPGRKAIKLKWTTEHPASHYRLGVMLYPDEEMLDGFNFRMMRDGQGAKIVTTDPEKVCRALGIPTGEAGIEKEVIP